MTIPTGILSQQMGTECSWPSVVYRRAPIVEAIIELRVVLEGDPISMESCVEQFKDLRPEFPEIKRRGLIRLETGPDQLKAAQSVDAMVMSNNRQTVVIGPNVFGFSQLAPYSNWTTFRDSARLYWNIFSERLHPLKVVRIATRFVNRIDIPIPVTDIKKYFATGPMLGAGMSDMLAGFYMQLQLPQVDLGCIAIVNEALIPPANENAASFLLDIDVFEEGDFADMKYPWQRLEEFRIRKNQIFESCITDHTRELFR